MLVARLCKYFPLFFLLTPVVYARCKPVRFIYPLSLSSKCENPSAPGYTIYNIQTPTTSACDHPAVVQLVTVIVILRSIL